MRPIRLATLLAAALLAAACQARTAEPGGPAARTPEKVRVGHVGSMTGSEATVGQSVDNAIQLAIEQWNARGGIQGRLITLRTLDTQGKPEEAATAATRLVTSDKVHLLLGEETSSRTLAMAPIADGNGTPLITPSATNPRVTRDRDKVRPYVFRVCFIDPFQGTVAARFARDGLHADRVAVLRDVGNDYSVGLADNFTARFQALGGTIAADLSYKAGDQDFKAQLTALKGKKPQVIYVPGYYTDVALIARQARELGITQPMLGGDGWDSPKLVEIAGKAIEGSYFTNHYSPDDPSPRIREFVKSYQARFGVVPDGLAALGYDAAMVGFTAMSRAPDLSGTAVRDAIAATKDHPGVTGIITLDESHDAVKPAVILQLTGGKPVYVATVTP